MYKRVVLWEGKIDEIDPKEYGEPLIYFWKDYDAGILQKDDSILRLRSGVEFPGKVGQKFRLVLELEEE